MSLIAVSNVVVMDDLVSVPVVKPSTFLAMKQEAKASLTQDMNLDKAADLAAQRHAFLANHAIADGLTTRQKVHQEKRQATGQRSSQRDGQKVVGFLNMPPKRKQVRRKKRRQRGGKLDLQKALSKTGIEFHWPGYQYMGPGTKLEKRLKRGDPGINRLDRIAKRHDIDYRDSKSLKDMHKEDRLMIQRIERLPGRKTKTERIVKNIMKAKVKMGV